MRQRILAVLVGAMALASAPAAAQQTTGTINGRVLDAQGATIPGASVTVTSPATGFSRSAVTDGEGTYRLSALNVGRYDILVELSGFTSIDRKDVVVNVGQTITLDFTLTVDSNGGPHDAIVQRILSHLSDLGVGSKS